ncbi:TPA: arginine--tRNA ligase, partial [Candidatus Peregrinibacteria bacterium]|nr:arginine--tRNA ligase [Candidatus Peregrinibacteria bacterium]HIQ57756.1 arginine--tRNA ligase [Candidatus Gracilibacteria bacterium]
MKQEISQLLQNALTELNIEFQEKQIIISTSNDAKNGDFSCNIAMQLAKKLQKNPREIANNIIKIIINNKGKTLEKIEIAGPGFLNFFISKDYYAQNLQIFVNKGENIGKTDRLKNKTFIAEHTDPNLFKEIHIGHVMTNVIGESFYRLAQFAGANVKNVTFQGDVGMHIAKALWGIQNIGEELPLKKTPYEKQKFLGKCYVFGEQNFSAKSIDNKENSAKIEITQINKEIYEIINNPKSNPELTKIYKMGCEWSLEYLETIYKLLGSKFDHYFLESSTFTDGARIVKENTGKKGKQIFTQPEKAIIFEGEKFGYHTRVFINSEGLPTYEAKDIGLFYKKWEKYNPDYSLTITGGDQKEYFTIVKEVAGLINPEWKEKTMHRAHGILKLKTGKMSS